MPETGQISSVQIMLVRAAFTAAAVRLCPLSMLLNDLSPLSRVSVCSRDPRSRHRVPPQPSCETVMDYYELFE